MDHGQTTELTQNVLAASNYAIAAAYVALGYVAATKAVVIGHRLAAIAFKFFGATFFVTCAFTHLAMAHNVGHRGHGPNGVAVSEWVTSPFGVTNHVVQAIAGWGALILWTTLVRVLIANRKEYEAAVEDAIDARLRKLGIDPRAVK